jgi:hypothetical protein
MNCILVSSDLSFPYSLSKLNPSLADSLDMIFTGEVSPKETYRLLTEKWGMGKHLASGLIGSRGGNIHKLYKCMENLIEKKKRFQSIEAKGRRSAIGE